MTIRTRIFLVFSLAIIVGFGILGRWINNEVKEFHNQAYEEVLVDTANVFAELVSQDLKEGNEKLESLQIAFKKSRERKFSAQIYNITKQNSDLRIYVTDPQGKVSFDSHEMKAVGEDYSEWRDVRLTLEGKYGARSSDETVIDDDGNSETISVSYVAAPVMSDGIIIGVISIGKPKTNIDKFVDRAKQDIITAVVASILFVLMIALLLHMWVSKPLKKIVTYAEKIQRGERADPPLNGGKEIRQVAQAMADMRSALEDKQYVERYVQTLTHEIKSPLTAIIVAAELLDGELPEDKRHQFSANIIIETERLNDFATRLLQLAAVEKLDQLDVHTHVDIGDIINELAKSLQPLLHKKNLIFDVDQEGDLVVSGDAFLLKQAIGNLLRNAIEFSPDSSRVRLQIKGSDNACEIEISDEGPGIPDYALPHIFERFYSLPRLSGKKSTGLGLNFVKEVAELHNGRITLDNLPANGVRAKFHINHIEST